MKRLIEFLLLAPAAALAIPVLVDSALKGAVLLVAVLAGLLMLKHASAALRHFVLIASMVTLLALPVLSVTLPGWRVLPSWAKVPAAEETKALGAADTSSETISDIAASTSAIAIGTTPPTNSTATPQRDWIPVASWIWLAGGSLLGLWLAAGQYALWRLGQHATPNIDSKIDTLVDQLRGALGVRRKVTVLSHPDRTMPMTWGLFKTRLLLPAESADWEPGRVRAVLLHELAHVKRRDSVTQLLVRLTCAVHWFNPLVWIAARKIATERERACDDLVLNSGVRASDYAEHLLQIATGYDDRSLAGTGAVAMAKRSRLEGRLTTILSRKTNRRSITPRTAIAIGAALALCAMPVAMMQATAEETPFDHPWETPTFTLKLYGEILSLNDEHQVAVVDLGTQAGIHIGSILIVSRHKVSIARLTVVDARGAMSGCLIEAKEQPSGFSPKLGDQVRQAWTVNGKPEKILGETPDSVGLYQALSGDGDDSAFGPRFEAEDTDDFTGSLLLTDPWDGPYRIRIGQNRAPEWARDQAIGVPSPKLPSIDSALNLPPRRQTPSVAEQAKTFIDRFPDNPAIQRIAAELANLRVERAQFLKTYLSKHPKVIAAETMIEALEKTIVDLGEKAERKRPERPVISGIGAALLFQAKAGIVVKEVIEGGSAHRTARLVAGDRITAIGEGAGGELVPTAGMELVEVVERIRGKTGTTVRLKLSRANGDKRRIVIIELPRAPIQSPPQQQIMRTYALRFVDAESAAKAIDAIIGRKAEVTAGTLTNSVAISADEETHKLAVKMLRELDAAQ